MLVAGGCSRWLHEVFQGHCCWLANGARQRGEGGNSFVESCGIHSLKADAHLCATHTRQGKDLGEHRGRGGIQQPAPATVLLVSCISVSIVKKGPPTHLSHVKFLSGTACTPPPPPPPPPPPATSSPSSPSLPLDWLQRAQRLQPLWTACGDMHVCSWDGATGFVAAQQLFITPSLNGRKPSCQLFLLPLCPPPLHHTLRVLQQKPCFRNRRCMFVPRDSLFIFQ